MILLIYKSQIFLFLNLQILFICCKNVKLSFHSPKKSKRLGRNLKWDLFSQKKLETLRWFYSIQKVKLDLVKANAIRSTLSQIWFEIGFKSLINWLFQSELSRRTHSSRQYNTNSDTKFNSKFEFDQKYIEFDQKWSKTTGFLIKSNIFDEIQQFSIKLDNFWLNSTHFDKIWSFLIY